MPVRGLNLTSPRDSLKPWGAPPAPSEKTATLDVDHLSFLRDAARQVEERLSEAKDMLRSGRLGEGKWHPTGFATFEVARIQRLGVMRLHVWPVGLRRELVGHPKIHKHNFQLYSKIVAGTYLESLYEVREGTASERRRKGYLRKREFRVDTTRKDGIDRLVDTGRWVDVRAVVTGLSFREGSWHEIQVGQFHSTPIPKKQFCITLAVLSLPVPGGRDVLLGSSKFKVLTHPRAIVTDKDADMMCRQYADYVKEHP